MIISLYLRYECVQILMFLHFSQSHSVSLLAKVDRSSIPIILSEHLSLPRIVQAIGFTLYLEVDFWSQSVMLPAERPRLTWTIPTLDTQLPAWQSWESRTFVIAPSLSTRPHPSLFSPVVLKSFLWVWNKKYFVPLSSINIHAQAVEIYYCLFFARI